MNIVRAFPYEGKVKITTGFGWDQGPTEKEVSELSEERQTLARKTWPREHQGLDIALLDSVIKSIGFSWLDYPILSPIEGQRAEYIPSDNQGVSNLRIIGPWWEVRIKHVIQSELTREIIAIMAGGHSVPIGTPLGATGNVGLSFGEAPSYGRHLHYSFLAWGTNGEIFFSDKIGPSWNVDTLPDLEKKYGAIVKTVSTNRGIRWMGKDVLQKTEDPFLQRACYECNPQSIGM